MRICILSMEYPPYPSYVSAGGVGTHTYYLSKALVLRGHEVHVIACGDHEFSQLIDGVHVHRISSLPSKALRVPVYSMKASKMLHVLNKTHNFDIVHNQSPYGFFEAYLHRITKRIKLVTTIHAVPLREMANSYAAHDRTQLGLRNLTDKLTLLIEQIPFSKAEYAESNKIISVSSNVRADLIEFFKIAAERIRVIHNGVDVSMFNPNVDGQQIRNQYGLGDSKIILYVGRLERIKGVYQLLEIARRILEKKLDVRFMIVGSGRHEINLVKIGRTMGNKVVFTGKVPNELLPLYYSAADIVVLPSLYEGCPMALLEAMASAKPIVTTNIPSITEIVENREAVMINPTDIELFVERIIDLLLDEDYRGVLGSRARSKVSECFAWEKIAEETEKVYEEVVNEE
jgi:glycosyltransferase involved in cell wall biosynthesis